MPMRWPRPATTPARRRLFRGRVRPSRRNHCWMVFIVFSRLVVLAGNASSLRQGETCGYRGTPWLDPGGGEGEPQGFLTWPSEARGPRQPRRAYLDEVVSDKYALAVAVVLIAISGRRVRGGMGRCPAGEEPETVFGGAARFGCVGGQRVRILSRRGQRQRLVGQLEGADLGVVEPL